MLITNDEELLKIAKSHQIKASTIQDLQNDLSFDNNINKLTKNKENLFLQDVTMSEPLSLTNLLENNNDYDENDNSDDDISYITSDIDNLNITNPILNMRRKEKNTYKINKSNDNDITQSSLNNDIINEQKMHNQELMIKSSRETENTNHYNEKSINSELKSFYKNYDIVKNNLCSRSEEFVCCLDQIIEGFVQIILQEKLQDVTKPKIWLKKEGLESVKEIYKDDKNICNIIEKIIDLYTSLQGDKNIQPYDFMSLFECWYRLIQAVEEKKPNDVGIHEIKHYLDILKDNLSQANDDDDDDEELIIPSPRSENEETFSDTNVKDYNEDMSGDKRENLKCRTEKIHTHMTDVIEKLNKSMVMKCVEQASILEQSLKLMLALINKEDVSDKKELVQPVNIHE
ncbi:unnamed protein product [Danaus chrysippus]|uniref:(African queen) hypothetical protein n=1 Tax=Danaus chrysippus TaxID=151541 RepID=A0A8J2R0W0_9NEOP|nr:unnamed protein product [Danaus chrysippus]